MLKHFYMNGNVCSLVQKICLTHVFTKPAAAPVAFLPVLILQCTLLHQNLKTWAGGGVYFSLAKNKIDTKYNYWIFWYPLR